MSWTVMIGAYAGTGCGDEAPELFLQMQQGNVELGEYSAEKCLELEPNNAGVYAILVNTYVAGCT